MSSFPLSKELTGIARGRAVSKLQDQVASYSWKRGTTSTDTC